MSSFRNALTARIWRTERTIVVPSRARVVRRTTAESLFTTSALSSIWWFSRSPRLVAPTSPVEVSRRSMSARLSEVIREQCEGIRANVERTDRSLALYNLLAAGTAGQAVDAARSDGQDHLAKVAIVDHHEVAQHVAADQRDDRRLLTSQVRADHKVEVDRGQAGSGEAEARRVLRLLLNAAGCSDVDGADRRNAELTHDGRINGAHARARVDQAHTPNRGRWRGSLSTELMREDRMDSDGDGKQRSSRLEPVRTRLARRVQDDHVVDRHRLRTRAEQAERQDRDVRHGVHLQHLLDEERHVAELLDAGHIGVLGCVEGAHELRILDQDELALVVLQQLGTMRVEELALLLQRVGSVHGVLRSILPRPPRLTTRP